MAESHYTADSASPPRLMLVLRRHEVTELCPVSAVPDGTNSAGKPLPTARSSIV
jgi:hypothetical protein